MGPDETPFEVGLGFSVCFEKPIDFIGRQALLEQKKSGWTKQLLLCEVLSDDALILHDEPVYADDEIVGHCTSGGKGFRTQKTLAFVMLKKAENETIVSLSNLPLKIEVAGNKFDIRILKKPPYQKIIK